VIVRLACLLTLSGYALKHFAWTGRLISGIYSESLVAAIARSLGFEWQGIFINAAVNPSYLLFIYITGFIFAVGALLSLSPIPVNQKVMRPGYILLYTLCAALIFFTALSGVIETKLHYNVLIEYSIKITVSLLFLYYALDWKINKARHIRVIKWVIALTFIGHGVYALGIFPIPDNFLMMTSNILKTGRDGSIAFLAIFGALDIVASILLFVRRTEKYALGYMTVWGLLTALARLTAYYGSASTDMYLAMWLPEFLVRAGHYLLPLYLLFFLMNLHRSTIPQVTETNNG
jgi:hypothetical protein